MFYALLISVSLFTHDYYMSVTNVRYKTEQQTLQVEMKVFIDDIENAIKESEDIDLRLGTPDEIESAETYIAEYVASNFGLETDGVARPHTYVGREYEDDALWIYLESREVPSFRTVEIFNRMLIDTYPRQRNIINVYLHGSVKSTMTKYEMYTRKVEF